MNGNEKWSFFYLFIYIFLVHISFVFTLFPPSLPLLNWNRVNILVFRELFVHELYNLLNWQEKRFFVCLFICYCLESREVFWWFFLFPRFHYKWWNKALLIHTDVRQSEQENSTENEKQKTEKKTEKRKICVWKNRQEDEVAWQQTKPYI